MLPDVISGIFGGSALVLALAALINSIAYILRRRVDISATLVQSMIVRVNELEHQAKAREAEIRALRKQVDALIDENEQLRDSISAGRIIPERARRDTTGRHGTPGSLTASIAEERGR